MKVQKLLFLALLTSIFAAPASNAQTKKRPAQGAYTVRTGPKPFVRKYGMAGCGFGSLLIGKQGGQIFAATTNGTSINQSFGITSGTSNCEDPMSMNAVAGRVDVFVNGNQVALASDIARGSGETLQTLAKIMKCSNERKLGQELQGSFGEVFPSAVVTPNEVTDSILNVIVNQPELASTCQFQS